MADTNICPVCGAENTPASKICQRCQNPLVSFQPGQTPTAMDTGELEPLLPQWLKDARQSAKQDISTPATDFTFTPAPAPKPAPASKMDLLAGLQSQAGDDTEEEVPDWLASITGKPASAPKTEEPTGINWMDPPADQPIESPDWLAGLAPQTSASEEKDELTEWFRETESNEAFAQPKPIDFFEQPASTSDTPDWLHQLAEETTESDKPSTSTPAEAFGATEWFTPAETDEPATKADESTDWFNNLGAFTTAEDPLPAQSTRFESSNETPDWLNNLGAFTTEEEEKQSLQPKDEPAENSFASGNDTPDWLNSLGSVAVPSAQEQAPTFDSASGNDTPDWLNSLGEESTPFAESVPTVADPFSSTVEDTPTWLTPEVSKTLDEAPAWLGGQGNSSSDSGVFEEAAAEEVFEGIPDWLKSAAPEATIFDEPASLEASQPASQAQSVASSPFASAPAFEDDIFSGAGNSGLFTEMPDWLSNAMESSAPLAVPEPITGSDALAPNVLPSWVEAMRPIEQAPSTSLNLSSDQTLESRGALAGLAGVLPAGAAFLPTSKPKAYSIKLNASEEQLRHAGIFEQILAAETSPEVLNTENVLHASRALRWTLSFILLVVVFAVTFLRTQIFSMPVGVPVELVNAVAVAQAMPAGAPVLVAVDYDPARAGEMEAAAAPLLDNLLLLKQPRLTFVASNETGAILAERFMTGALASHLQNGVTYQNLGYLAGGQMGIRTFAQSPVRAMPLDIYSQPVWTTTLQDVQALHQFAIILIITDNANAARAWVEQTEGPRGAVPILVISSAQAAPMIQPYYEAGQVKGMISGLYGGAIFEQQYNNNRPGTARTYWDAYSIGMILAVLFVTGGGLVSLVMGMRDRTSAKEAK